jgi:hypothetical protein
LVKLVDTTDLKFVSLMSNNGSIPLVSNNFILHNFFKFLHLKQINFNKWILIKKFLVINDKICRNSYFSFKK